MPKIIDQLSSKHYVSQRIKLRQPSTLLWTGKATLSLKARLLRLLSDGGSTFQGHQSIYQHDQKKILPATCNLGQKPTFRSRLQFFRPSFFRTNGRHGVGNSQKYYSNWNLESLKHWINWRLNFTQNLSLNYLSRGKPCKKLKNLWKTICYGDKVSARILEFFPRLPPYCWR